MKFRFPDWLIAFLFAFLAIFFLLPIFLLLLPIILPVVGIFHLICERKIRRLAQVTVCKVCGKILGNEARRLANAEWSAWRREYYAQNPGVKAHFYRAVEAICPHCGTHFTYFEKENALRVDATQHLETSGKSLETHQPNIG